MDSAIFDWESFKKVLNSGNVIPIIGKEFYVVDIPSEGKYNYPLYKYFSEVIYEECINDSSSDKKKIPKPSDRHNFSLVCQFYLETVKDSYHLINDILKRKFQQVRLSSSSPLKELATIESFKYFMTTAFDSCLFQAIKSVRRIKPEVFYLTIFEQNLLNQNYSDTPIAILHLFGCLYLGNLSISYTEKTMIETINKCIDSITNSDSTFPFCQLNRKKLLLLIDETDKWLFQYLINAFISKDYHKFDAFSVVVSDLMKSSETGYFGNLLRFLESQGKVEYFPGKSDEFINCLVKKIGKDDEGEATPSKKIPDDVFISFEKEDRPIARKLEEAFERANISVWLDEKKLRLGNEILGEIIHAINNCKIFIALTSIKTIEEKKEDGNEKYHIKEWRYAYQKREGDKAGSSDEKKWLKIVPVVIDDVKYIYKDFEDFYSYKISDDDKNFSLLIEKLRKILGNSDG